MPFSNLLQSSRSGVRRGLRVGSVMTALVLASLMLSACGQSFFQAGRTLPPSGILNRVMIAVQNAGAGQLAIVDAFYDIRHNFNNTVASFAISGYNGTSLPLTIQNLPAEQTGGVFSISDGSYTEVNYATEAVGSTVQAASIGGIASSIFTTPDKRFVISAQQQAHVLSVLDAQATPTTFLMNLPGVYRVSINPGGTIALGFVQNSNLVYSVVHLSTAQQQQAATLGAGARNFLGAYDCEPQNLPQYCIYQVNAAQAAFDRPTKAIFSPDGASAWVIDCGPECGGTTAGVTQIPLNSAVLNPNANGPAGISLATTRMIPVPGGATNGIFSGNTLYVAGQQLNPSDGLFTGELSAVNTGSGAIAGPYPISDGQHTKMLFGDDNTLWIGSSNCQGGERYKQVQAGANVPYGCMTMFNTSTNAPTILSYKGDGTGIAAIITLHKVYTTEGGQVYIYSTRDGSSIDNSNVSVSATAVDVAYMDAPDDSDNATY